MARFAKPVTWLMSLIVLGLLGTWGLFIVAKVTHSGRYARWSLVCFGLTAIVAAAPLVAGVALLIVRRVRSALK
jgi:hypothetical protein